MFDHSHLIIHVLRFPIDLLIDLWACLISRLPFTFPCRSFFLGSGIAYIAFHIRPPLFFCISCRKNPDNEAILNVLGLTLAYYSLMRFRSMDIVCFAPSNSICGPVELNLHLLTVESSPTHKHSDPSLRGSISCSISFEPCL
jgi:hypothetical protein